MLQKVLENKKIWLPIAIALILIVVLVIGIVVVNNTSDDKNKGNSGISDNADKENSKDKPNENGLSEVKPNDTNPDTNTEDVVNTPESWDGNNTGTGNSNSTGNNNQGSGNGSQGNGQENGDNQNSGNMTSGDTPEGEQDVDFGTIF
jgi:hypothetical protein